MNSRPVRLPARLRNFGVLITLRIGRGGTRVIGRARVGAIQHPVEPVSGLHNIQIWHAHGHVLFRCRNLGD